MSDNIPQVGVALGVAAPAATFLFFNAATAVTVGTGISVAVAVKKVMRMRRTEEGRRELWRTLIMRACCEMVDDINNVALSIWQRLCPEGSSEETVGETSGTSVDTVPDGEIETVEDDLNSSIRQVCHAASELLIQLTTGGYDFSVAWRETKSFVENKITQLAQGVTHSFSTMSSRKLLILANFMCVWEQYQPQMERIGTESVPTINVWLDEMATIEGVLALPAVTRHSEEITTVAIEEVGSVEEWVHLEDHSASDNEEKINRFSGSTLRRRYAPFEKN